MAKSIVICCDGTNNQIVGDQTNVLRLFRMLVRDSQQVTFYDPGVGTQADRTAQWPLKRLVHKRLDAAIGESMRPNVLDAYRFLIDRYEPEDALYLFGFSRGAYTVRALAAMIFRCGLLYREHAHLAPYAWAVFTDEDQSGDRKAMFGGAARIKEVFSHQAKVHLIGVWDTVGSFGWSWNLMTIPNTASNPDVQHVRHALSIDERRSQFTPEPFTPPAGQDCKEVWFAGGHSDVGGGYRAGESGLARITLEWMLRESLPLGLRVDPALQQEQLAGVGQPGIADALAPQHNESVKPMWRVLSWLPKREYSTIKRRRAWHWPNLAGSRQIAPGSVVHESVRTRMTEAVPPYKPALPSNYSVVP